MARDEYWTYLANWILMARASRPERRPLIVGLSAPQGAGKSTLAEAICQSLAAQGVQCVGLSIDDFYLTHADQLALTGEHPDNRFLAHRGLPGTHDVELGRSTLLAMKSLGSGQRMRVPSYDRSAFHGRGDRRPQSDWPMVEGPIDVVLLEGWMLGFAPVRSDELADPQLGLINEFLAGYSAWHELLDAFIWLEPDDEQHVRRWRAEAEQKTGAAGRPAMPPDEIAAFVDTFLPAYATYYAELRRRPPADSYLHLVIGADRLPIIA